MGKFKVGDFVSDDIPENAWPMKVVEISGDIITTQFRKHKPTKYKKIVLRKVSKKEVVEYIAAELQGIWDSWDAIK